MRELKNKELIAGLIILILLSITAMILIVKKEMKQSPSKKIQTEEESTIQQTTASEEEEETEAPKTQVAKAPAVKPQKTDNKKSSSTSEKKKVVVQNGEKYTPATLKEYKGKDRESQLEELYNYWNEYQLNAVADLIRLERIKAISKELKGTNNFYYYGDKDKNGAPDGNGLAIYENNAYYCGEWKNGVRSGEGMWLQIYPDKAVTINGVKGVIEHSYNGMFAQDYPNGKGQEHFDYDMSIIDKNDAYNNVIGNFKDGYYDDELYIMTINQDGHTTDWDASAQKGVFLKLKDVSVSQSGFEAVWEKSEEDGLDEEDFKWLHPTTNGNFGIYGLKK